MAQYKSNFYGTSYYGNTNAFSGTYETAPIQTEEPLNNTFNVNITALLPDATYSFNDEEIQQSGTGWVLNATKQYLTSNIAGDKLTFGATSDKIVIAYQARPNGCVVNVKVTTTVAGQDAVVAYNQNLDTNSTSIADKTLVLSGLSYGYQLVEITIDAATPNTKFFYFKNINARVTDFTIETRAAADDLVWSNYSKIMLTKTLVSGNQYTITGTSPNYAGKTHVQVRVWMASSDNDVSPEIQELDTYAGDTSRRTEDATYIVQIDMNSVSAAIGQTFSSITGINWTADIPDKTEMVIRSRTTNDASKATWTAKSVPYVQGVKRLRLKEGVNEGYVITPLVNPASINPFLRIDQWNTWDDTSYMPPDESDVRITYSFLDERDTAMYEVNNPKYITDRRLSTTPVSNKPYRLKIYLKRRFDKASPVVDAIRLSSTLIYEQDNVITDQTFSAVSNQNTGEQMILDMKDISYNIPAEATSPTFTLIDKTERPLDVVLYLDSMKNLPATIAKPNDTKLRFDKIWAKVKVNTTPNDKKATGVLKHYQYGGGNCIYGNPDETPMAASFTPSLKEDRKYRYFIMPGWYEASTGTVVDGSANANVDIFWKQEEAISVLDRTNLTDYSSHNAIVAGLPDTSSESIISEVTEDATWGEVEWVSEEKVFFGTCNLNDKKGDYVRRHETPVSGDSLDTTYVAVEGDTYDSIAELFGIDTYDLRYANSAGELEEPTPGVTLIIPSRIVLPYINPLARIGANPYIVDVVYNSVRSGGKVVPDSRINRLVLDIEEEEVTIEKEAVVRGTIANGTDFLKNAKVTQILGIWNLANDPILAPNYTSPLDYSLSGNAVDWGSVDDLAREPAVGATYYVSYKCKKPKAVKITIGSDYQEEGGIDRVWRSTEVKEFTGVCAPGVDYKAAMPEASTWRGANDPEIEDLEYIIEDNDLWVKTWIEFNPADSTYYAIGSLQDRIPKDNWFPYIHTGYYYLGKDEYYLFSEPTVVEPTESDVAKSEFIEYVPGKYSNAAKFEKPSTNYVRNSGFETRGAFDVVQRIKFGPQTEYEVAELGITR